ncbi:hypothetical protein B0H17DRAFT_1081861, partial [Mycena rosella]
MAQPCTASGLVHIVVCVVIGSLSTANISIQTCDTGSSPSTSTCRWSCTQKRRSLARFEAWSSAYRWILLGFLTLARDRNMKV